VVPPKEFNQWAQATTWKTPGQNSIIHFPSGIVYSISVLDVTKFEGIDRQIPDGTGIDESISCASKRKKRMKNLKKNR
jgi:hypothetical protein